MAMDGLSGTHHDDYSWDTLARQLVRCSCPWRTKPALWNDFICSETSVTALCVPAVVALFSSCSEPIAKLQTKITKAGRRRLVVNVVATYVSKSIGWMLFLRPMVHYPCVLLLLYSEFHHPTSHSNVIFQQLFSTPSFIVSKNGQKKCPPCLNLWNDVFNTMFTIGRAQEAAAVVVGVIQWVFVYLCAMK